MKIEIEVNTFGELLSTTMHRRGATTRSVSKELGMSPATVSRICSGKGFDVKWIVSIAIWCGINPAQSWALLR
ncbi:hypothetical protein LCGC14_1789000 [marine sediment metagenome]|uniref:Uncharacterized protein n=1 Tax=marine sediment metagenome TaxID=412755 RepID=A0A0F9GT67_9ZZZZ